MTEKLFPDARDITIEINGKQLAAVESYGVYASRDGLYVESFGEAVPVGIAPGAERYTLELSRLYLIGCSDGIRFSELTNFQIVIRKPDRQTVYSDCEWITLSEQSETDGSVIEHAVALACARTEQIYTGA